MRRSFSINFAAGNPLWLAILLTITPAGTALSQQPLGNISGVVTDPSGASISGATITATSLASGATRTATTNDQGYYLIPTVQAGAYKLVARQQLPARRRLQ